MSMIGRSAVRNHCLRCVYFIDTTLGEGVKEMVCVFDLDLEAKMTVIISFMHIMKTREVWLTL